MKYYTGIGSRECPEETLKAIKEIGAYLGSRGWTLRSGGADGADKFFETGCDEVCGPKEIYLPWEEFNYNLSFLYLKNMTVDVQEKAKEVAQKFHPAWDHLSWAARVLMTRNSLQILGQDMKTPSSFVVCYSIKQGGTTQAMRIAQDMGIPIFNIADEKVLSDLKQHMQRKLDFLEPLCYSIFD